MSLTSEHREVLNALYGVEQEKLYRGRYDVYTSTTEIGQALPATHAYRNDTLWIETRLEDLWIARQILQFPPEANSPAGFREIVLEDGNRHGPDEDGRLRVESNDVRNPPNNLDPDIPDHHAVVAVYRGGGMKYRSRVAEISRLLARNYQKFGMGPATGLLRYELRHQRRPVRDLALSDLRQQWTAMIRAGRLTVELPVGPQDFALDNTVNRDSLATATDAVLAALAATTSVQRLASFQTNSTLAILAGLYSSAFRNEYDAHVVTAGVGSGKSFAFQIGGLIHAAYRRLHAPHETGFRILLLYPRVALAANQFQELSHLIRDVATRLGISLHDPTLDAGGQLIAGAGPIRGALYQKIVEHYQAADRPILVSNLDSLVNRLHHPEALAGLVGNLDLVVCDEVHLARGIYGAHTRVLLHRLKLLRAIHRIRARFPSLPFAQALVRARNERGPYHVAASATIAEPQRHTGRVLTLNARRVLHIPITDVENTGWVHHLFLRQKPEVSTMSALINATSCLIHNRRDGLFREYLQSPKDATGRRPSLALDQLSTPVRPGTAPIELREPRDIHKTVGFCDSLDGIGRWSDQFADNERTKFGTDVDANPRWDSYPYYTRFLEPLWRRVHQWSFARVQDPWQIQLRQHYGQLCRQCKKGVRCTLPRIPAGLSTRSRTKVDEMWGGQPDNGSYLERLGLDPVQAAEPWLEPYHVARTATNISNLEGCSFFQTGLCWWWSEDHVGGAAPAPASIATPLNGVRPLQPRRDNRSHFVNSGRVLPFTSEVGAKLDEITNINEIFRAPITEIFNDQAFTARMPENATLLLGSPRLEVGVDLARVMDGITFRAMRDPSSLQQKSGRVGRENGSDSLIVHVVTMNARDLYYFRNPQIALDPDYLQALPLHENNRIVLRHHLFMAIVDFLCLQGGETGDRRIAGEGERILLINDHRHPAGPQGWRWNLKVAACWDFLFGSHPHAAENLANLREYLRCLGARPEELDPQAGVACPPQGSPAQAGPGAFGAIDVFRHDFGAGFFLSLVNGQPAVAQACSSESDTFQTSGFLPPNWRRHREFLVSVSASLLGEAKKKRSYLQNLLTSGVFRRGVPAAGIPGNHPYVWTSNFFDAIGTETVRVQLEGVEVGYVSVSAYLALLAPGTVTYRYGNQPAKVSVGRDQAGDAPVRLTTGIYGVHLKVHELDWFEITGCQPIDGSDLPPGFYGFGPVQVYRPRQVALQRARSEPLVVLDGDRFGLLADGDSAPITSPGGIPPESLNTPPRSFAKRWYRIGTGQPVPVHLRFSDVLEAWKVPGASVPAIPLPPVLSVFDQIEYDPVTPITDFIWGLDRQMTSRAFEAARLVYRAANTGAGSPPVAVGTSFEAPALRFTISTAPGSTVANFVAELLAHFDSAAFQVLLWQSLNAYLDEHGRLLLDPSAPLHGYAAPSSFALRNLKTVMVFHLLSRWYPDVPHIPAPTTPPLFTVADIAGCFTTGHPNELTQAAFDTICRDVAEVRQPTDITQHATTLRQAWVHFVAAQQSGVPFDLSYVRKVAVDRLANSLGIALHAAGLRQSGAEDHDLGYFYRVSDDRIVWHLFDTDPLGNGTTELLHEHLFIPEAHRTLVEKLRLLGHAIDPLPTTDFAHCFEEELNECASSQAAHLAFHGHAATGGPWDDLAVERDGEKNRAGAYYAFMRTALGLQSFDDSTALRECPEFVAYISTNYPALIPLNLGIAFPSFQALENASNYCLGGCVGCLVAPERNLHGPLKDKDTVNKPLLDAFARVAIAMRTQQTTPACFPANGPGCTCAWSQRNRVASSALGATIGDVGIQLELTPAGGGSPTALPLMLQVTKGPAPLVLRPDWNRPRAPLDSVRVHMRF